MLELGWAPETIGRLTIVQAACLLAERCPEDPEPIADAAAYLASLEAERRAEETW